MKCIIPLAGPDFIMNDGTIRPLFPVEGEPLLVKALQSRPWIQSGETSESDLVFVLRDTEKTAEFKAFLKERYSSSRIVTIEELTAGALLSSMAGISQVTEFDEPICVDLVDILYEARFSPAEWFKDPNVYGIIPYFHSQNEKYSYLKIVDGFVKQTIEKKVISDNASAGTYFFRDAATFLESVIYSMRMSHSVSFKDNLFLCPAFNGLTVQNKLVKPIEVFNIVSISELFHKVS